MTATESTHTEDGRRSVTRTWCDVEEIALDLADRYPETDPLQVELHRLRSLVISLPSFGDRPDAATDEILESIRAAWYEASEG